METTTTDIFISKTDTLAIESLACDDKTRPAINGIRFEAGYKCATNGHYLIAGKTSYCETPLAGKTIEFSKAAHQFAKTYVKENKHRAEIPIIPALVNIIPDTYPNIPQVLPNAYSKPYRLTINAEYLAKLAKALDGNSIVTMEFDIDQCQKEKDGLGGCTSTNIIMSPVAISGSNSDMAALLLPVRETDISPMDRLTSIIKGV